MSTTWPPSRHPRRSHRSILALGKAPATPSRHAHSVELAEGTIYSRRRGRGIREETMSKHELLSGYVQGGNDTRVWMGREPELESSKQGGLASEIALRDGRQTSEVQPGLVFNERDKLQGDDGYPSAHPNPKSLIVHNVQQSQTHGALFQPHTAAAYPDHLYHLVPFYHDHAGGFPLGPAGIPFEFPRVDIGAMQAGRVWNGSGTDDPSLVRGTVGEKSPGASMRLQEVMGTATARTLASAGYISTGVARPKLTHRRSMSTVSSASSRKTSTSRQRLAIPTVIKADGMTLAERRELSKRLTQARMDKRLSQQGVTTPSTASCDTDTTRGRKDSISSTWDTEAELFSICSRSSSIRAQIDTQLDIDVGSEVESTNRVSSEDAHATSATGPIAHRLRPRPGSKEDQSDGPSRVDKAAPRLKLRRKRKPSGAKALETVAAARPFGRIIDVFDVTPVDGNNLVAGSTGGCRVGGIAQGIPPALLHPSMRYDARTGRLVPQETQSFSKEPPLRDLIHVVHDDQALTVLRITCLDIGKWHRVCSPGTDTPPDLLGYVDSQKAMLFWFVTYEENSYRIAIPISDITNASVSTPRNSEYGTAKIRLGFSTAFRPTFSMWSEESTGWQPLGDFTGGAAVESLSHDIFGSPGMIAELLTMIQESTFDSVSMGCECLSPSGAGSNKRRRTCRCPTEIIKAVIEARRGDERAAAAEPPAKYGSAPNPTVVEPADELPIKSSPASQIPRRLVLAESVANTPPSPSHAHTRPGSPLPRALKRRKSLKLDAFLDTRDLVQRTNKKMSARDPYRVMPSPGMLSAGCRIDGDMAWSPKREVRNKQYCESGLCLDVPSRGNLGAHSPRLPSECCGTRAMRYDSPWTPSTTGDAFEELLDSDMMEESAIRGGAADTDGDPVIEDDLQDARSRMSRGPEGDPENIMDHKAGCKRRSGATYIGDLRIPVLSPSSGAGTRVVRTEGSGRFAYNRSSSIERRQSPQLERDRGRWSPYGETGAIRTEGSLLDTLSLPMPIAKLVSPVDSTRPRMTWKSSPRKRSREDSLHGKSSYGTPQQSGVLEREELFETETAWAQGSPTDVGPERVWEQDESDTEHLDAALTCTRDRSRMAQGHQESQAKSAILALRRKSAQDDIEDVGKEGLLVLE